MPFTPCILHSLFQKIEIREDIFQDPKVACDLVLQWLRRPWAVITVQDITLAFRGLVPGDEQDDVPRGFSVLTPFLQSEVEDYLMVELGVQVSDHGLAALRRFILSRITLHRVRHQTLKVWHSTPEVKVAQIKAQTIIDLLATWLNSTSGRSAFEAVEADLNYLVVMLQSGQWLRDFLAEQGGRQPATQQQQQIALEYLDNPESFTSHLFRFDEPEFRIEEWIDTFPPESLTFRLTQESSSGTN